MSTNDTAEEQSTDLGPMEWPCAAGVIGVDQNGIAHRYSRGRNTVYMTRNRQCVRVERLDEYEGDIDDWIDFVESDVGWRDVWFHDEGGVFATAARLERARTAADADEDDPDADGSAPVVMTDGGRESRRTCARCDADALPGSRFCRTHSEVMTDGGEDVYSGAEAEARGIGPGPEDSTDDMHVPTDMQPDTDDDRDDIETVENVASGVSITAKLKRGSGTRNQDTLKIKAKGTTAAEAIANMDATLEQADEWAAQLRDVQPDQEGEGE